MVAVLGVNLWLVLASEFFYLFGFALLEQIASISGSVHKHSILRF